METKILKVVRQGETFMVDSQKAEGGKLAKCNILLQEMGGNTKTSMPPQCSAIWRS